MDLNKNRVTYVLLGIAAVVVGGLAGISIFLRSDGIFRLAGVGPFAADGFLFTLLWRRWRGQEPVINWLVFTFLGIVIVAVLLLAASVLTMYPVR